MTPFCHRCAQPLESRAAFCPSCGVPQIRVVAPEPVSVLEQQDAAIPHLSSEDANFSASPGSASGIDWKAFLRIALPLAFLSGTVTVLFAPLGLALLPGGVILGIARYRRDYEAPVTPSQGGWLGACTGLLSFSFFMIFAGINMVLNRAELRASLLKTVQEQLSRNPDPNFQQIMNSLATPAGIFFMVVLTVIALLILFVALATVTGTLTATMSGNRNRR